MLVGSCFITLQGESEGLSLNQDLFLRIAHPISRDHQDFFASHLFFFFFGSTVLTSLFSLFYVTRQCFTGSYTVGEPVFFRSFGLFHFQVQKGMETIILKKIVTDVFHNRGCVAPHTLNV